MPSTVMFCAWHQDHQSGIPYATVINTWRQRTFQTMYRQEKDESNDDQRLTSGRLGCSDLILWLWPLTAAEAMSWSLSTMKLPSVSGTTQWLLSHVWKHQRTLPWVKGRKVCFRQQIMCRESFLYIPIYTGFLRKPLGVFGICTLTASCILDSK
jgi:hypothetical protein